MIVAADERWHTPDAAEKHWQESYYFNWADTEGKMFTLARIGRTPAEGKVEATLFTISGGHPAAVVVAREEYDKDDDTVSAGGLTFTMNRELEEWHIGLDRGRNQVDLTFTASHEPHCYRDGLLTLGATEEEAAQMPMHFEQAGTVKGTVVVNGRKHEVNGGGHRDKSWGPREYDAIKGWEWLTAQFGPDLGFNATLWYPPDRDPIPAGFITRDGTKKTLLFTHVDFEWQPLLKHVPKKATITLVDEDEQQYVVKATALGQMSLYKKGLFIQETHARFEMIAGREVRTGHGVLEHAWHSGGRGALQRWHQFMPLVATGLRQRVGV